MAKLAFVPDGAQLFSQALDEDGLRRVALLAADDDARPGTRLFSLDVVADLTSAIGPIGCIASGLHGADTRPVRAIMFDKRADMNWALSLHQDRTIAVATRKDVPGFGPWSTKAGQLHVKPPPDIIARMVTLRVHLDDVDADNAPLLILPGTHNLGHLDERKIETLSASRKPFACHARRGDVWAYGTAILHGSAAVRRSGLRRRVLQIDYSREALPSGLAWAFA